MLFWKSIVKNFVYSEYMDIQNLQIVFLRDYKLEYQTFPKNTYYNFSPVNKNVGEPIYPICEFRRHDPVCIIKHKTRDLWAYEGGNNKIIFAPVKCDKDGFYYKEPIVFFVEYLDKQDFYLYKYVKYGDWTKYYLRYKEVDGQIFMDWVVDWLAATIFSYESIQWVEESTYYGLGINTARKY